MLASSGVRSRGVTDEDELGIHDPAYLHDHSTFFRDDAYQTSGGDTTDYEPQQTSAPPSPTRQRSSDLRYNAYQTDSSYGDYQSPAPLIPTAQSFPYAQNNVYTTTFNYGGWDTTNNEPCENSTQQLECYADNPNATSVLIAVDPYDSAGEVKRVRKEDPVAPPPPPPPQTFSPRLYGTIYNDEEVVQQSVQVSSGRVATAKPVRRRAMENSRWHSEDGYECPECGKHYHRNDALLHHRRKTHGLLPVAIRGRSKE